MQADGDKSKESLSEFLNQLKVNAPSNPSVGAKAHKFWDTQPLNKSDANTQNGPIEQSKLSTEIRADQYTLPSNYEWYLIDVNNPDDLNETYKLLSLNYVEDDDCTFRFDYSPAFLSWALKPPGWRRDYHLAVRTAESKKLVAFISGVPASIRVFDSVVEMVEINFLCIHKKLRSKRLAPVLIKEITRRCHLNGIFQAVYTAGIYLPKPMVTCQYYHRPLAPKKLIDVGFSSLGDQISIDQLVKIYKLDKMRLPGLQLMREVDVEQVTALLAEYHSKFDFSPKLSVPEVRHWLLPIDRDRDSHVTDFISFYALNSTIIGNPDHSHLNAAYLYYYATKSVGEQSRIVDLVHDALIISRDENFDVFNCLDLADNQAFLKENLFGAGSGKLHYYAYNYKCKEVTSTKLSLVML